MVTVLGIAGSPRRSGNTDQLLARFLAGAEEAGAAVTRVVVTELEITGCTACNGCWTSGECIIRDDFQAVNRAIIAADVVALAAPLFFWNLPAQSKALVDRSQCQWARKRVLHAPLAPTASGRTRRRGVFISVGGEPEAYFEAAVRTARGFFSLYETDLWAQLLYGGIDAKGEIEQHPTALDDAFALGERAVAAR